MYILNKTNVTICLDNHVSIEPNNSYETQENMFDTHIIFSELGAINIDTEYNIRSFTCYGQIYAEEFDETDCQGLKRIIVMDKDVKQSMDDQLNTLMQNMNL